MPTSDEHQRHLGRREVQRAEQVRLQGYQFWKGPELTAIREAQPDDGMAGKGFEQGPARDMPLGLTYQVFQQAVDQEANHQREYQADRAFILVQPERVHPSRTFEHREALLG